MRIPYKIFGVAILVFLLMGASIVYSTFKLYQVSKQVTDLAQIFIPLSDQIATIDLQIAEQGLHVERLEKHLTAIKLIDEELHELEAGITPQHLAPGNDTKEAQRARLQAERNELESMVTGERDDFERREAEVDAAIKTAVSVVERAATTALTAGDRTALQTLLPLLQAVDLQHSSLHAQLTLLLNAFETDNAMRLELERLIEAEEDRLSASMRSIWDKVTAFTQTAASEAERHERQALTINLVLAVLSGIFALLLAGFVIRGMMRPLRRLMAGTSAVEAGNLAGEIPADTRDEIGDLTRSFNTMVRELRKTEEIKETFGQYVDPRVVSGLLGDSSAEMVNGEKKVVSVFFADLANFTGISERFTPGGMVKLINRYLELMSGPVTANHGLIDKYIGDAIMAFWSPPFCADGDQASLAVAAALEDVRLVDRLRLELPELTGLRRDLPDIGMRIGIATGDAVVGSIGSERAKNFTVIGDTVNLGSRLEGANKAYGTSILVCSRTCEMASRAFEFRKIDHLMVAGKTEPVSIFEPIGPVGNVDDAAIALRDRFETALAAFHDGDWRRAADGFSQCRLSEGADPATETYLRRLAMIDKDGPPADWDGIWRLDSK